MNVRGSVPPHPEAGGVLLAPLHEPAPPRAPMWPLALLIYATFIPFEAHFVIGEQTLYPTRIVLLALLPWVVREVASGNFRVRPADWASGVLAVWMVTSFVLYYGFDSGIFRGVALAFDTVAAYFVARLCIRSANDVRRLLIATAPGFAAVAASIALESFTRTHIVRPFFTSIFGALTTNVSGENTGVVQYIDQYRLGLLRAAGPFSHPILGGIYLASILPLYAASGIRGWPRLLGIGAALCAIFSVSSAAALTVIVMAGLFIFEFFQRRSSLLNWPTFIVGMAILALLIQIGSERGLVPFLLQYSLDTGTAYFRLLIWQYGTASVALNPWIGIGFSAYDQPAWMGQSLDNQWLLLAVRHGLPGVILALLAVILALVEGMRAVATAMPRDRMFTVMVLASYTAVVVAGITVAFFGSFPNWFGVLQGCVVSLGAFARTPSAARAVASAVRPSPA